MSAHLHSDADPAVPLHVVLRSPRVLVLHGDHALRARLSDALLRIGCHPVEANCAEEALTWLKADRLDLALVSQALPGMSGVELIELIRASKDERLHDLPVIGLPSDAHCESELAEVGVDCFIRSPHASTDLIRAVRWIAECYWVCAVEDAESPPSAR